MICSEITVIPSWLKTKGKTIKLSIIQAAVIAALFLIAAAVSYHSGYVGGRVDEEAERSSAIWNKGRDIGLAANGQDGQEVAK